MAQPGQSQPRNVNMERKYWNPMWDILDTGVADPELQIVASGISEGSV